MKKKSLIILLILSVLLSACGGGISAASPAETVEENTPLAPETVRATLGTSYEDAASVEMQLLIGTLKLDGTGDAVTKDQAAALLPLWEEVRDASMNSAPGQGNNDSASEADPVSQAALDELLVKIQALMTPDQTSAIARMQITQTAAMTSLEEMGVSMGGPQSADGQAPAGNPPSDGQAPQGNPPPDGQAPQGNPPSDGQAPQGNPPSDRQARQGTPPSDGNGAGALGGGRIPPGLINALIVYLGQVSGITVDTTAS
jgi:hypothetical protein